MAIPCFTSRTLFQPPPFEAVTFRDDKLVGQQTDSERLHASSDLARLCDGRHAIKPEAEGTAIMTDGARTEKTLPAFATT